MRKMTLLYITEGEIRKVYENIDLGEISDTDFMLIVNLVRKNVREQLDETFKELVTDSIRLAVTKVRKGEY